MSREAVEELAWRKFCKSSVAGTRYWHIAIPRKGLQAFQPYKEQEEILELLQSDGNLLILKARQIGMTTLISYYCFWYAATHPDSRIVVVSRRGDDAKKIVKKILQGYKLCPEWLRLRCPLTTNATTKLGFENGSEIESIPSREHAARGDTVDIIIVDEWAFLNDPEEAWRSIEPTSDVGGKIVGLSTPDRYGSWFHNFCRSAKFGKNNFKYKFLGWQVATHRDESWFLEKMDTENFAIEYASDDESCWVKGGDNVFDSLKLPSTESMRAPVGTFHVTGFDAGHLIQSLDGPLAVWEMPVENGRYLISADVAKGGSKGDFNAADVLRRTSDGLLKQVAVWHGKCAVEIYAGQLAMLSKIYGDALVVAERNGQYGVALCDALDDDEKNGKVNTYKTRDGKGVVKYTGFYTGDNKIILISNLRTMLYDGKLAIYDGMTLEELFAYSDLGNGKLGAPSGSNDDRVMALAIGAFVCLSKLKIEVKAPVKTEDPIKFGLDTKAISWFPEWNMASSKGKYVSGFR